MQACPYDALYLDPNTHTAAKCNYCAHRTELGLEPACVVVCPERAIIAGDLHNPASEIARIIAREPVRVRKPEQGTGPNVYYLGADEAAINPEAAVEELPHMTMWSTLLKPHHENESAIDPARTLRTSGSHDHRTPFPQNALRAYQPQSPDANHRFSREARIVYDTPKNRAPWGWKVSTYLGTKSIGAGAMIVAALLLALNGWGSALGPGLNALLGIGAPVIGGIFVVITLVLLTADLKRPDRALYLVLKSNLTSWLVWGAYILGIFGLIEAAWFLFAVLSFTAGLYWLLVPAALFGIGAAGYTAFLFGQAEGRDFWQSPLLLPVLIAQAALAGSAALGLLAWALGEGSVVASMLTTILLVALALHGLLVLIEVFGPHTNSHVAAAAHYMVRGPLQHIFWGPFFAIGTLIPLLMLVIGLLAPPAQPALLGIAGIFALVGLFAYEHCFVTAGQAVPLS
jgi:formate-dependent nitrite reductase membrane component NrfD